MFCFALTRTAGDIFTQLTETSNYFELKTTATTTKENIRDFLMLGRYRRIELILFKDENEWVNMNVKQQQLNETVAFDKFSIINSYNYYLFTTRMRHTHIRNKMKRKPNFYLCMRLATDRLQQQWRQRWRRRRRHSIK